MRRISRRRAMGGVAALASSGFPCSPPARAQAARDEFLIRNASILTMDPAVPDLARGDIHVRAGAIVRVAEKIDAMNNPKANTWDESAPASGSSAMAASFASL